MKKYKFKIKEKLEIRNHDIKNIEDSIINFLEQYEPTQDKFGWTWDAGEVSKKLAEIISNALKIGIGKQYGNLNHNAIIKRFINGIKK